LNQDGLILCNSCIGVKEGKYMAQKSRLIVSLLALLIAGSAPAQAVYPDKPIRIIVGLPPGSQPDTIARLLGQKLSEALGKPVTVENVTGAAGNIAADRVAKAAPDGFTLGLLSQTQIVVNPSLYKLAYDALKDFAPISQVSVSGNILVVHNTVPVKNFRELLALAKAQPGTLTFASGGSGSGTHLAGELLKSAAGIDIRHIPYKGVTAAIPDLIAGRVSMMFSPIQSVAPLVHDGRLRALAVSSLRREPTFPAVPTVAESGFPGFEVTLWNGLLAPAGTPEHIVQKLQIEMVKVLGRTDLRAKFAELGLEPIGNTSIEFAQAIKTEIPRWSKVIQAAGITPD
jgi:tripartite-type tricarboxylate transporter receptor subunit TctC